MPTTFDYAALALDVYRDNDRPALPPGWRLYQDFSLQDDTDGYFGACYLLNNNAAQNSHHIDAIVFAHRGTVLSIDDMLADVTLALGHVPDQYIVAREFVDRTLEKIKKDYPDEPLDIHRILTHTGHSLGAILSDVMCATGFKKHNIAGVTSITFENPGSKPILNHMAKEGKILSNALEHTVQHCQIHQTHYNIVNTSNEQVNNVRYMNIPFDFDVGGGPITDIPSEYYANLYYLMSYSIDQHRMRHIYNYLASEGELFATSSWPYGFENGYNAYRGMGYDGLPHTDYWDKYIKICWESHRDIRDKYNHQYQSYHAHFIKNYLAIT